MFVNVTLIQFQFGSLCQGYGVVVVCDKAAKQFNCKPLKVGSLLQRRVCKCHFLVY